MQKAVWNKSLLSFAFVLLALCASSCFEGSPAGPIFDLVPGNAIMAVVIEKPARFYGNLEAFWKSADLSGLAGGSLSEFMEKTFQGSGEIEKSLDASRPWVLAMVPTAPGSKEVHSFVYLPLRNAKPEDLEALSEGKFNLVAEAKGYAVFADGIPAKEEENRIEFPPKNPLNLSALARYPADSIKIWTDPLALKRLSTNDFEEIKRDILRFVKSGEVQSPDSVLQYFKDGALALFKEMDSADGALVLGQDGLTIRTAAEARPGSAFEKLLVRAAGVPSALDWTGQVSADSLYGYAWSLDPGVSAELSDLYLRQIVSAFADAAGKEGQSLKGMLENLAALEKRWAALQGPRGAASFDFDFDFAALKDLGNADEMGPEALATALKKSLAMRIETLQELRDETKYRELMRGLAKDPDVMAMLDTYAKNFGLGMKIRYEDKKIAGFSYGELSFELSIVDPEKFASAGNEDPESLEKAEAALKAVSELYILRYTTSKGRLVMTMGDSAELKALSERTAAPKSLAAKPDFAAFAKRIPAKPLIIGALSINRLLEVVKRTLPPEAAAAIDSNNFGSWYSYLSAEGKAGASRLEFGMAIPARDISSLMGLIGTIGKPGVNSYGNGE